jgi:hypothetical protein
MVRRGPCAAWRAGGAERGPNVFGCAPFQRRDDPGWGGDRVVAQDGGPACDARARREAQDWTVVYWAHPSTEGKILKVFSVART